jgi:Zn ribbon nucleic-acid-binding protein
MKNGNWKINRSPSRLPENIRASYQTTRLKALNRLGGKCVRCGFSDERALQIDHVNGGGNKERQSYKGAAFFYHVINLTSLEEYQVLCANCNFIKRREEQECKRKYEEGHTFPTEEAHVKVFKPKVCKICTSEFVPTNGRQLRCAVCVKG